MNFILIISIFFLLIFALGFISKKTISNLFFFFLKITKNQKVAFRVISLIFFPGTIIHEFSHYFIATLLFLKVKEIKIFPEIKNNQIKLGHVLYYKKDFIRSILVGISPFFGALIFFFFIFYFNIFPSNNLWQNLFLGYLIFAVSSTMFSSKEDLVDIIYLIPIFMILSSVIYIFDIKIDVIIYNKKIVDFFLSIINSLNFFLFISFLIHLIMIFFLNMFHFLKNRKSFI